MIIRRGADTGAISGFVTIHENPTSEILVLLVPSNLRAVRESVRLSLIYSDDGSFLFRNVAPGAYTVIAVATQEGGTANWAKVNWAQPEVFAPYLPRGEQVTVLPNTHETNVTNHVEVQPQR